MQIAIQTISTVSTSQYLYLLVAQDTLYTNPIVNAYQRAPQEDCVKRKITRFNDLTLVILRRITIYLDDCLIEQSCLLHCVRKQ